MNPRTHPFPDHYDTQAVDRVFRVPYEAHAREAVGWAKQQAITSAASDAFRVGLLLIDVQNTFCLPDFELFVGGRSGRGAVDDNRRLVEFIYRNLGSITQVTATMDTHHPVQVFHALFFVDADGNHPTPMTMVTVEDIEAGRWQVNPHGAASLGVDPDKAQEMLLHYTRSLQSQGKYDLTIWPYHAMLGGIGHALVSSVEEAVFFHAAARHSQPIIEIKGEDPFTEHYSAFGPEVLDDFDGKPKAEKNAALFEHLMGFDAVIVAGQAKSHCVAWTVEDLLKLIQSRDPSLAEKIYLLEDCTSPVVIPGVVDFTDAADEAFARFADAGMHLVRSTDPLESWLDIKD